MPGFAVAALTAARRLVHENAFGTPGYGLHEAPGSSPVPNTMYVDWSARVIHVAPNVGSAGISGVTITGGQEANGDGGNILNEGTLLLSNVRVTGGTATNGGGIASTGTDLAITSSLIDANTATSNGGGILNRSEATASNLTIVDSTIFSNHAGSAGGLQSDGNPANAVSLVHVTMAENRAGTLAGAGLTVGAGGTWTTNGSLFVSNTSDGTANCNIPPAGGAGMADDGSCGSSATPTADIGLATQLTYKGGQTDVLEIPSTSVAKGAEGPQCTSTIDQRSAPRPSASCDMGAYEEGATAPPVTGFQLPVPPAPTPTPTTTPTPTPTVTPVAGQSVAGVAVQGKIRVRKPGSKDFIELDPTKPIPLGSTIDSKQGTILLTSQQTKNGKPQSAKFFDGIFKISQTATTTDLTLNEALAKCPRAKKASTAAKKPKTRKLWGSGSGSFRTRGQYSSATVRGTEWLVQDSCSGTLTRVTKGVVSIRDNVKRKTIILRAGKKYLARPRH